jgi:UDP-N-acetylglucosamine 1-carboxyvinyltransferase
MRKILDFYIMSGILFSSMQSTNEKIGQLIYQIRQDRGLTQAEFARKLGTSQSAVNRIEHGKQNLSLDTLARISDVLNKPLISVAGQSTNFRVEGGAELKGTVETKTAKNSAVALLCASLLNQGTTRLLRVPRIEEVNRIIEVLISLGVKVKWYGGNNLEIKPPTKLDMSNINAHAARRTRSVIMLAGPLLHYFKEFRIPYAGGCKLGKRSVQTHLYALEELGVTTEVKTGWYNMKVKSKPADKIVMYEMGETPTENILMAAARRTEKLTIHQASSNYNVQDLCHFLQKLGVNIDGIGTPTITIKGINRINKNVSYTLGEDPVDSMFFIAAAVVTNSQITVTRCPIEFLEIELLKLEKMGVKFKKSEEYLSENHHTRLLDLTIYKHDLLTAPKDKIHPLPFPGLLPDNLPFFVPIAAVSKGHTLLHDWMYENRAIYFTELSRLGANVELIDAHRVFVNGPTAFSSADVTCPPALRPAAILLIGMLAATGTSMLRNVYSINRGYEDIAERLNSIGARIQVINEL